MYIKENGAGMYKTARRRRQDRAHAHSFFSPGLAQRAGRRRPDRRELRVIRAAAGYLPATRITKLQNGVAVISSHHASEVAVAEDQFPCMVKLAGEVRMSAHVSPP